MSAPTKVVRITHLWCATCQGGARGKARCGTPAGSMSIWPANTRRQVCVVCAALEPLGCEWCGGGR